MKHPVIQLFTATLSPVILRKPHTVYLWGCIVPINYTKHRVNPIDISMLRTLYVKLSKSSQLKPRRFGDVTFPIPFTEVNSY